MGDHWMENKTFCVAKQNKFAVNSHNAIQGDISVFMSGLRIRGTLRHFFLGTNIRADCLNFASTTIACVLVQKISFQILQEKHTNK